MSEKPALLEIEGLAVRYGAIHAVRGVSLSVWDGELVTLLGANGAGKSSVLNAVMGLVPVAGGQVRLQETKTTGWPPERVVRRGMTLIPEGRRVFANLSVTDNLVLGSVSRRDRAGVAETREQMFDLFPVLAERRDQVAGTLSGGEQQMLAIARALMSKPRVLLLDEPSLGLAPQVVDSIFELIAKLRTEGYSILLVEQNVDLALEIADRGYVLASGEIALAGSATELRESAGIEHAYLGIAQEESRDPRPETGKG